MVFATVVSAAAEQAGGSSRTAPTSQVVHCRSSATSRFASSGVPTIGASTACRGKSRCPRLATLEAIVGTDSNQVAVAPGELRRTWSEGGRRYFQYVSDIPIHGTDVFFSADYAVHRETWQGMPRAQRRVDVQVYLHPRHTEHLERLLRGVRA